MLRPISIKASHQKNRQYITNKKKNATIPTGPYCRHMAIKLMFLACFRYFADSSRNELDNVDIPTHIRTNPHEVNVLGWGGTIKRISTINQILDILRHNP